VNEIVPFIDKIKKVDFEEGEQSRDRITTFRKIIENIMVKYPGETKKIFAKLWVLEDGEEAPNAFRTMATLFSNEVAMDFFTSVLPSLLHLSRGVLPLLSQKN
jgi:hypothetical protein